MVQGGDSDESGVIDITFALAGEAPAPTSVVGDFNDWDPTTHPLLPKPDGTRQVTISVAADRSLCFRFAGLAEPNLEPREQAARRPAGQSVASRLRES